MGYTQLTCGRTRFAVDWGVVERFIKSYWFSYYQREYANARTLQDSTWYNPFSWSMPRIQTVDTDWDKVASATRREVARQMADYRRRAGREMSDIAYDVKYKLQQTYAIKREMRDWLREIQDANVAAMQEAERSYTGLIEACRFVRDTSTDIVAVGSTIATGGAAVGLLAGSSVLKGTYKYQDTGRVGASVLHGAGSMLLGAFKIKGAKPLSRSGEYVLIVAQGTLEGATALASGKSFGEAVAKGSIKIATASGAKWAFDREVVKNVFRYMPIPFTVWVPEKTPGGLRVNVDRTDEVVAGATRKVVERVAGGKLSAAVNGLAAKAAPAAAPASSASASLIDNVSFYDMGLLYFSIVNMDKGIGHGW
jgi:hypothetical protein